METDKIKLIATYGICLLVIVGGGLMLYFTPDQNLQLVLAGFIGSATTWVFSSESATRATKAAEARAR